MSRRACVGWVAALTGAVIIFFVTFFGYYTKTETYWLTYFPDNTYQPTSNLPNADIHGQPKVVLVRKSGQIDCFNVFYSAKLKAQLEESASRRAAITYKVKYRLRPVWVETVDVAGLGIEPTTSPLTVQGTNRNGNADPGECF